ncbi:MAG: Smr/MutS family protein [Synergistaceae bacterium]|nr:Smr/MutS family protein [Synergistaceae bacterium]
MARMTPARGLEELAQRHELFGATEEYRDIKGELPWNFRLSSVGSMLEDAKSSGMLAGDELLCVRRLLEGAARVKEALVEVRSEWPVFSLLIKDLRDFAAETEALSVIDDDGRLCDRASDRLRRLREDIRRVRDRIRAKGRGILSDPALSQMLQERVLTLRNGRHAVLVRQDAMPNFPGLVMDRSGSGSSVYMEPHALVGLNNEHAICAENESTEERRILHRLTERILGREAGIIDAEAVLGRIDMFYAMSEKIRRDRWRMPMLTNSPSFRFHLARHPLLGESATPIDISCGEKFRVLVITGPNTGGKTVALKTAGVCVCLGWLGCPIPAEEDSSLGLIDDIYSDIGDEQSIEQNLSTFSAHVSQITKILSRAGERSVVLLDELGSGTDPEEGAALGIAILDCLNEKRSLVLATTHHNPIKRYALSSPGVESASVEFNANTLSPTYRLLVGIPGRSNALLIAGKLGMPRPVLDRAREALCHREASMEDIIGELQEKRTAIEHENIELDEMRASLDRMRADYERQMADLTEERDRLLADADKKALGIVENAENSAKSLIRTIGEEARSAARRKLERTKKDFSMIKEQAENREGERLERAYAPDKKPLEAGDNVVIMGTSAVGVLEAIEGGRAMIIAGATRMELPLKMLRSADAEENRREKRSQRAGKKNGITLAARDGPGVKIIPPPSPTGVPSSLMIRGMTLDEAIPIASQYLDRAYRAGYGEVSIIHGRGEGILRREVQSLCGSLPYVESFRLGEAGEGGFGVTIVRFRT